MKLLDTIKTNKVYIIAEMSANHSRKLETALEIVHAAKKSGAHCLKVQTYTPNTLTIDCGNDYFRIKEGLWAGYKLYDLYNMAYMPWEWHEAIKSECDNIGLDFLSTPFDKTAVDFLEEIGVEFYKIASFELVDIPLIEYVASKKKPIIISCGMGSIEEIWDAIDSCKKYGNNDIILLKCCSEYPANLEDMNLSVISDMRKRFGLNVGLSDHSMGSLAASVAVSMGACVIEKHFCLDRKIESADSEFSMEPDEFKKMADDIDNILNIKGVPDYKLSSNENKSKIFRRSIFAVKNILKGSKITTENIKIIRPGYGLAPKYYDKIIGAVAKEDILFGQPLALEKLDIN